MEARAIPSGSTARGRLGQFSNLRDEGLARLVGGGSHRAFAALYQRYHQALFRYCRSILRHDADAQDALQSAFTAAYAALRDGRRNAPLRPWLFRIAHNEAINVLRQRRQADEVPDDLPARGADVPERANEHERLERLVGDLRALPERQRAALLMRELSGLSHEEIAVALDASVAAAKQTIFEARRSLAEFEQGRAMSCEDVCRIISDGDRRATRSRRVTAHLRHCAACSNFAAAIPSRAADLRALAPALPPGVAAALVAGATGTLTPGGGGAGATGFGAGAGKTAAALATAKATAGVAVVAATVGAATVLEVHHHAGGRAPDRLVAAPSPASASASANPRLTVGGQTARGTVREAVLSVAGGSAHARAGSSDSPAGRARSGHRAHHGTGHRSDVRGGAAAGGAPRPAPANASTTGGAVSAHGGAGHGHAWRGEPSTRRSEQRSWSQANGGGRGSEPGGHGRRDGGPAAERGPGRQGSGAPTQGGTHGQPHSDGGRGSGPPARPPSGGGRGGGGNGGGGNGGGGSPPPQRLPGPVGLPTPLPAGAQPPAPPAAGHSSPVPAAKGTHSS